MKNFNVLNDTIKRNNSHIYAQGALKNYVKNAAISHIGREKFNPRPARYRSNRGMAFQKNDILFSILVQILPIALLTIFLLVKYFI